MTIFTILFLLVIYANRFSFFFFLFSFSRRSIRTSSGPSVFNKFETKNTHTKSMTRESTPEQKLHEGDPVCLCQETLWRTNHRWRNKCFIWVMEPKDAFSLMLLIGWIQLVLCVEPLSGIYAVGSAVAALGVASYNVVLCRFYECCHERWIVNNMTGSSTLYNFHSSQGMGDRIHTCLLFLCFPR